jgi:hypothetical protein
VCTEQVDGEVSVDPSAIVKIIVKVHAGVVDQDVERFDAPDSSNAQIVTGDRVDRSGIAEELTEAVKHGLVFPMGVAHFKSVDLLQVFCDGDMERLFLGCFASRFKARNAELEALQFMALAPLLPTGCVWSTCYLEVGCL